MIQVNHLTKKYGDHVAVDDLTFELEEGHIYGFLGPNGAGKSTTMNIMTGYLAATSGEVKINGHDIFKDAEEAKKQIGYLPEMPPLYENMTVLEYLRFVAELKKIQKTDRAGQILKVMEMTQIVDVQNRLIQNLSKGYKQRVGIAQAVLGTPSIIILDEPTVGLDPKQIIEIREMIAELGKHHTIILSSHILTEISAVCDYVLILSHGRLVAADSIHNLQGVLNGNSRLELTVRGTKEEVEAAAEGLKKVKACEIKCDDAFCEIILETDAKTDIREDVFFAFANRKLPIIRMEQYQASLEDVFLELTGEEQVPHSEKKPKIREGKMHREKSGHGTGKTKKADHVLEKTEDYGEREESDPQEDRPLVKTGRNGETKTMTGKGEE